MRGLTFVEPGELVPHYLKNARRGRVATSAG